MSHDVNDLSRVGYAHSNLEDLCGAHSLDEMARRMALYTEAEVPGITAALDRTAALAESMRLWEAHAGATVELLRRVWESVENDWRGDGYAGQVVAECAKLVRPIAAAVEPAQRGSELPWGVQPAAGGAFHVICPLCPTVTAHKGTYRIQVGTTSPLWLAAAAAERHRDAVHFAVDVTGEVYDHLGADVSDFIEDPESARSPGWGVRRCEVCGYETFGGYESTTEEQLREHIVNAVTAESAARA